MNYEYIIDQVLISVDPLDIDLEFTPTGMACTLIDVDTSAVISFVIVPPELVHSLLFELSHHLSHINDIRIC